MQENTETRIAYLRPQQIHDRLSACPAVYVPVGPLEWHGPHLPLGVDPLRAERVARAACERTGGIVWQTVFFGTERERPAQMLEWLGLNRDEYVVGMDFPNNTLRSPYCPEEIFALIVREVLRQVRLVGARLAVVVNGHGGVNHLAVLERLAVEISNVTDLKVLFPRRRSKPGEPPPSGGHADAWETGELMYFYPETVDLSTLPPAEKPIHYKDFAIVDGPGFDGKGPPDHVLQNDPRTKASPETGQKSFERSVDNMVERVREALSQLE